MKIKKNKNLILNFIIGVLLCHILNSCENKKVYHGYVEAEFKYISPTTSGILKTLNVKRGQKITKNETLFKIDDTDLNVLIKNTELEISKSKAKLQETSRSLYRFQELSKKNIISKADLDLKNSEFEQAVFAFESSKQNLISLEQKLKEAKPISESDFFVQETFFIEGEFVQAGRPVVSLLSNQNIKIRFFIPQKKLDKKLHSMVFISSDSCKENIEGKITYISSQPEFTPPVIFNKDAREKMVFMIEATPIISEENKEYWDCLLPGIPVDINF
jgi:HlyD family secretion protein